MSDHLTTEREWDMAQLEIQIEIDELYQKWLVEFKGPRLAHQRAQAQAQISAPQAQPPSGAYPR